MADQTTPIQTQAPVENSPAAAVANVPAPGSPDNDEKFFAAVGYFSFLFVVPLILKPKSEYCKFHAKQSIALFLISIAVLFVLALIPSIGSIFTLGLFALYVIAIFRAYKGELWKIPMISNFAGKIDMNALYGKTGSTLGVISGLKEKASDMATQATGAVANLGKNDKEAPASGEAQAPAPDKKA